MSSPAVTAQTLGSPRGGFTGTVGFEFVAANAITVVALGRWVLAGNNQTHTLYLFDTTTSTVVGSVSLNTVGQPAGAYAYVNLSSSVLLVVGHSYECLSAEVSGLDQFCDNGPITLDATVATTYGSCVDNTPPTGAGIGAANMGYVPTSFLFTFGGTTYNVSTSESVSTADTVSSTAVFGGSASEVVAAADSDSVTALFTGAVAEAVTSADAQAVSVTAADTAEKGWVFAPIYHVDGREAETIEGDEEEMMEIIGKWLALK